MEQTSRAASRSEALSEDDQIDLRSIFVALWRRKGLILWLGILGFVLAYVLVSQVTPRYTSRASVMLDARSVQVLSSDNVVSDLTLNNPLLDTEAAVLRSNLMLERVILSFTPDQLAGFDPANRTPDLTDQAQAVIATAARSLKKLVGQKGATVPVGAAFQTPEERRLRRMVGALRQSVTVWREGQSYLISVSVETEDPELSMLLANGIAREYIDSQVERLTSTVRGAARFLTERVEGMRVAVETAEAAVEDYRINQLASGGMSAESMARQLLDLSTHSALAQADLVTAEARFQQIQSVIETDGIEAAAELLSSPFVLSLREQKSTLERQDADLSLQLGPEHPERQRSRASIRLITGELTREVAKIVSTLRNEVAVARIRSQSLRDSLSALESRSADMSRASLELRQLEREAEAVRASYQSTLSRLNETRAIEELQRADARVVDRAVIAGAPSAPRILLFSVLGGSFGLSAGILLAYMMSITGGGFTTAAQIERATGLTVVTSLPLGSWRNVRALLLSLQVAPYQNFAERLRQVRTTFLMRPDGGPVRSVLITSSVPGEGKTTFAVALAHVEALARRSCVLLDFDTRRSQLANDLGYDPAGGDLADYLRGACTLDQALHIAPERGFDLITTRRSVPQLADEVTPKQIADLIGELSRRYEMVVIDTPPLLMVSDSLALVPAVDVSILLVRQGATRRRAVIEATRRLTEMGARSLGVAMTMVDPRREEDAYGVSGNYTYGGD